MSKTNQTHAMLIVDEADRPKLGTLEALRNLYDRSYYNVEIRRPLKVPELTP